MRKSTGFLLMVVGLLAGIISGIMLAPAKNGLKIECGNNNGNYYGSKENGDNPKELTTAQDNSDVE